MDGLAQALDALVNQGILASAFIIGSITFFIALIGKIPTGNGHIIEPIPRFFLGLFGFIFALSGLGGTLFGIFVDSNTPLSEMGSTMVVTATPSIAEERSVIVVTATLLVTQNIPVVVATVISQTTVMQESLRPHMNASIGTGVFEVVTFSDGMAEFSDAELSTNYFSILNIRREEYPTGCATARFDVSEFWFGGSVGTELTVNNVSLGSIQVATGRHGYIVSHPITIGDEVCAVGFDAGGFNILLGQHMYHHYDSYCFRGYC